MTEIVDRIAEHPFTSGMRHEHRAMLCEGATTLVVDAGHQLFAEGEPAHRFYLIEDGHVAVEAHDPLDGTVAVQILGPGDALGWSWLFAPYAWHFRARTIEPATLTVLDGAHLVITAQRDHEFGYELMRRIARVLIERLQETRKQLLQNHRRLAVTEWTRETAAPAGLYG